MTILLDQVPADASRSTPRVEETPAPKLWANQARIVEVEFRACCDWFVCNYHKGPNVSGINPENGDVVRLFNPRLDEWKDHFKFNGALILPVTVIGEVTIHVLALNHDAQIDGRQALIQEGKLKT